MEGSGGHKPVLQQELLTLLAPAGRAILVDCTVGLGGHSELLLGAAGEGARLVGLDMDESNLRSAKERLAPFGSRVRLFRANFAELEQVLRLADVEKADLVLADLGISSNQLADASKGLSFMVDGPLDMRLDDRLGRTAADLVNSLGESELADLIYAYGEERYSRRIARAIAAVRKQRRIVSTLDLANLVSSAYPRAAKMTRRGVHPATRTFQALRIAVNDELENLQRLLNLLPGVLSAGGRAAVISFHSLEDRRVKQAFSGWVQAGLGRYVAREKFVEPTEREVDENPRSRSAKLRVIERLGV